MQLRQHFRTALALFILLTCMACLRARGQNPTPFLGLNRQYTGQVNYGASVNANWALLDTRLKCFGIAVTPGTLTYFDGSQWQCFAGNTSGSKVLQEDASGVLSWVANGGGGGGSVSSVFGRTGVVVAASADYSVAQVTGAAPLASPTFTGTVTLPTSTTLLSPILVTPALGIPTSVTLTNGIGLPESGVTNLTSDLALKAPLASPTFTGTVVLPANQILTTPTIASYVNATHGHTSAATGGSLDAAAISTGLLPVARGGTATATPSLVAGTNVSITGTWPNQTINASGSIATGFDSISSATNITAAMVVGTGASLAVSGSGTIAATTSATATALASNPTDCAANTLANAIAASGNLTCVAVAGSYMTNNTVTATQLAAQYSKWEACGSRGFGDGLNAIPAGTYLQFACVNDTGVTVTLTGIRCWADAGTSTLAAANNAGTALLTGAVTCNATKASGGAAGTQSATVTLASGDAVSFTFVTDGSAKQANFTVSGTY